MVSESPVASPRNMYWSMARPINHGPPAWEIAPSTTSANTQASVLLYGANSETRRRAVVPRSSARSWEAPAMDWMFRISALLLHLVDQPVLPGPEDGVFSVEAVPFERGDHHVIP